MIDELRYLGLTENEIAVYQAVAELGETTSGPIASKTNKQSSTVYYCLNSLIEQGFVTFVKRGKTKHYSIVDPDIFAVKMDEQIAEKQEQRDEIRDIIPEIRELNKSTDASSATVYTGYEGFKTWLDMKQERADTVDRYDTFVVEDVFPTPEHVRRQLTKHNRAMSDAGLTPRLLVNEALRDAFRQYYGDDLDKYTETRYTEESLPGGTAIFGDTVTNIVKDATGLQCFRIKNAELADSYADYFTEVWERADSQDTA